MQETGQISVLFALFLSVFSTCAFITGGIFSRKNIIDAGIRGVHALTFLNIAISLIMIYSLLSHDFSNMYVYSYTDVDLSFIYVLTAFWAGEKGALLFWILCQSIMFSLFVRCFKNDENKDFSGTMFAVVSASVTFFYVLIVFEANPFETFMTVERMPDGSGLNPLLQNPLMTIHPPAQLLGFLSFVFPFSIGFASLITNKHQKEWTLLCRKWLIASWLFMTLGIVLGGLWAYVELGWGGFWGWDPVENAALFPWLTCTALIHCIILQDTRRMFLRFSQFLLFLTFFLTIFATFLTRSQLISSLHAFSESKLSPYFLIFLLILVLSAGFFFILRFPSLKSEKSMDSILSREFFLFFNNLLFLVIFFIVLWGTMLPRLSESSAVQDVLNKFINIYNAVFGNFFHNLSSINRSLEVKAEWFNRITAPAGLIILMATLFGSHIPYRGSSFSRFKQNAGISFLISFVISGFYLLICFLIYGSLPQIFSSSGFMAVFGVSSVFISLWLLISIFIDIFCSVRTKQGNFFYHFFQTMLSNRRRYTGHMAHAGIALIFIGFAGLTCKLELSDVIMKQGDSISISDYEITAHSTTTNEEENYTAVTGNILYRKTGEEQAKELHPEVRYYAKHSNPSTEVAIIPSITEDLYVAMNPLHGKNLISLTVFVNPLMSFIWIGSLLLIISGIVILLPLKRYIAR
jgi:cytochrome c-type biogenesis protein CcmF